MTQDVSLRHISQVRAVRAMSQISSRWTRTELVDLTLGLVSKSSPQRLQLCLSSCVVWKVNNTTRMEA